MRTRGVTGLGGFTIDDISERGRRHIVGLKSAGWHSNDGWFPRLT